MRLIFMIFIFALAIGCSRESKEPGYEYIPEMVYSQAYEAYGESTITKNGSAMLDAPKNSIPRHYKVFTYGTTDAEKERAGKELSDPRPFSESRLERGKYLYKNTCLLCHGEKGEGDGPVAKKYAEPPAFSGRALRDYTPGQFYHAIVVGYGDMPSHAVQLDDDDRWDVILYLQKLQKPE